MLFKPTASKSAIIIGIIIPLLLALRFAPKTVLVLTNDKNKNCQKFLVVQPSKDYSCSLEEIMTWASYKKNAIQEAKKLKKSASFLDKFLQYAKPLFDKGVPIIVDSKHFAKLVGFEHDYVCKMAFGTKYFYRTFYIDKKNGAKRKIDEPLPDLKFVQHWILKEILSKIPVSAYAKAYEKNKSIKDNARFHRGQKAVVTIDIKDFFPSVRLDDVYAIFVEIGYRDKVASFLANLCCLDFSLPQGAPTSPYLSNLKMTNIDANLGNYCVSKRWRYTRYADDMTFSGDLKSRELILHVSKYLYCNGFSVNSQKTRVAHKNTRQEVTGIVVNNHMQVSKDLRKKIRQQVYYIKKYGLNSHLDYIGEKRRNYLNHLLGVINHALFINPKDAELQESMEFLKCLLLTRSDLTE